MPARYSILSITASSIALGLLLGACQPRPAATSAAAPAPTNLTPPDSEAGAGSEAGANPEPEAVSSPDATMLAPDSPGASPAGGIPDAFAGRWFVSAVFPTGSARTSAGDPHLGVSLVIGNDEVSDVNGQRCIAPMIGLEQDQHNLSLGALDMADLTRLTVTCKSSPFASYLLLPGRSLDASYQAAGAPDVPHALVADRPEARYLLERAEHILLRQASLPAALAGEGKAAPSAPAISTPAISPPPISTPVTVPAAPAKPVVPEANPAPAPTPAPTPALGAPLVLAPALPEPATPEPAPAAAAMPAPAAPAPAAKVAATGDTSLPAPGAAIHLASYSGISAAKRGWKILLGDFDALDPLSPLYVTVDVPEKGPMVRLYATGDGAGLTQACAALRAKGAYCELSR